jgi:hypothetical protein
LTDSPANWPFSSFLRCVKAGLYPAESLGGVNDLSEAGERE